MIVPLEIGRSGAADVKILWHDRHESVYPARALRLACPCAGCVDEVTGEKRLVDGSVPVDVHPLNIQVVGRYAVAIRWSDGHDTGIYTFERLRQQCSCESCKGSR